MNRHEKMKLATYIAEYINEEIDRNGEIDKWAVLAAIDAYLGGAGDTHISHLPLLGGNDNEEQRNG